MKLIFLGPPGAGKGTQAENICSTYNIKQLSTGDILRANRREGTSLGRKAQAYMDAGELVPDLVIIDMIKQELVKPELDKGYILDGFPRTVPQAEALDLLLQNMNQVLDCILVLNVPNGELLKRLSNRRTCKTCGKSYHLIFNPPKEAGRCDLDGGELFQRDDDKEATILNRLQVYEAQTMPLINYYKSKKLAVDIDGIGKMNEIFEEIKSILDKFL